MLALGDKIPEFAAAATSGKTISPAGLQGRFYILYFYPKDNTPGCAQEGREFAALHAEFARLDCDIFGVSRDSLKSHENFKCKQGFPFELLADADETLCRLFEVIKLKNMYGRQVLGIERSTFLVDRAGHLAREWRKVKAAGHAAEVLAAMRELAS
jgi:peroxiredoxin Q/BCP